MSGRRRDGEREGKGCAPGLSLGAILAVSLGHSPHTALPPFVQNLLPLESALPEDRAAPFLLVLP